ncbi:hypothetical protein MCEMIE11_00728 [Burkholderiales bacterium]
MFSPLRSIFLAGFFSLSASLQANTLVDISPFQVASYTNSFTKGFDLRVDMQISDSGQVTNAAMNIQQSIGKSTKRFGQDWIGVQLTGDMVIQAEKMEVRFLDLYDPKTKQLRHSIDLSDDTVTSYQWVNVPTSMQPGQRLKVGTLTEKDKSGKIILMGDVEFLLAKVSSGFEFCTIETSNNLESKEREMTKDCDQFDSNKKITGSAIEVRLGTQSTTTGTGKIRFK